MENVKLQIVPIKFKEACAFVNLYHRHHKAPQGHKISIGLNANDHLIGVAMMGRPVSRYLDNGWTLEVTRVCTNGTKNACSKLYSACRRVAKELGYKQLITYILDSETGISLRASGWKLIGKAGGLSWDRPSRPRKVNSPLQLKYRYEIEL